MTGPVKKASTTTRNKIPYSSSKYFNYHTVSYINQQFSSFIVPQKAVQIEIEAIIYLNTHGKQFAVYCDNVSFNYIQKIIYAAVIRYKRKGDGGI